MAKQHQPTLKPEEVAKRLSKALDRDTTAFTSALLALIKKRGMTIMAKEIGVSRHTLYRYTIANLTSSGDGFRGLQHSLAMQTLFSLEIGYSTVDRCRASTQFFRNVLD